MLGGSTVIVLVDGWIQIKLGKVVCIVTAGCSIVSALQSLWIAFCVLQVVGRLMGIKVVLISLVMVVGGKYVVSLGS